MTAVFAGLLILVALSLFGWLEDRFSLKTRLMTFRVTTPDLEDVMARTNQLLTKMKVSMQHFQVFRVGEEYVMEFDADVSHSQQQQIIGKLTALNVRCEVVPLEIQRE